ncbi:uncharacterized protein PRCAT00000825001 [Priceomyces carsonii]|uniref:uncharacterized protein n=1 Tax=Priceomyces carsonii TaxID=28549 RepID=UPI002ED84EC3|nr:unnamed protein product [Priceomyces carsonii]
MSELPENVVHWLANVLKSQYLYFDIAYRHIYQFLQVHLNKNFGFRIRTSVYTSRTGQSSLLVNLYGSIKIRNAPDIPVTIWIPLNYPFTSSSSDNDCNGVPIVYVNTNAKNERLRPGNFIDGQGRFYHPFLTTWYQECILQDSRSLQIFNLLELVEVLYSSFSQEFPIEIIHEGPSAYVSSNSSASQFPPKPAKIPISKAASPQTTDPQEVQNPLNESNILNQNSGNFSPRSGSERLHDHALIRNESIPPRYLSPLPLPHEQRMGKFHSLNDRGIQMASYGNLAPETYPKQSNENLIENAQTDDLIDRNDNLALSNNDVLRPQLERLSQVINLCLEKESSSFNELNRVVPEINNNTLKVDTMCKQLNHHKRLAQENSIILDKHITYLNQQLNSLSKLNLELSNLDDMNSKEKNAVFANLKSSVELDNLIIPDLQLVKQLYNIVCDIKATKDTVSLISGSFHSQQELISNGTIDICLKSVRSLGRELFWLELMKSEISENVMGL